MYPIVLRATPGAWQLKAKRREDEKFHQYMEKVFLRDNHTCQFCGFQAIEFQEVVNIDHDYQNNKLDNLTTACCFCAQCFFIESVGVGDYGGGTLIYLPEISQSDLNSFCHVVFCAISNDTGYKSTAQSIYRSFKFRSQVIEQKFGDGASKPAVFGQMLIETGVATDLERMDTILRDVRLLPSRAKFKKQIEHWASAALEELAADF